MGAYVSKDHCKTHYNITIRCHSDFNEPGLFASDYGKGQVPADPDVAGIGVSVFIDSGMTED